MAWLKADGSPVATKTHTFQLELPAETPVSVGKINWPDAISAIFALSVAMATQNPAAMIAAVQALIAALQGN